MIEKIYELQKLDGSDQGSNGQWEYVLKDPVDGFNHIKSVSLKSLSSKERIFMNKLNRKVSQFDNMMELDKSGLSMSDMASIQEMVKSATPEEIKNKKEKKEIEVHSIEYQNHIHDIVISLSLDEQMDAEIQKLLRKNNNSIIEIELAETEKEKFIDNISIRDMNGIYVTWIAGFLGFTVSV